MFSLSMYVALTYIPVGGLCFFVFTPIPVSSPRTFSLLLYDSVSGTFEDIVKKENDELYYLVLTLEAVIAFAFLHPSTFLVPSSAGF